MTVVKLRQAARLVEDCHLHPPDVRLGALLAIACFQDTSIQRSGVSANSSSVSQSMVWMVTPLPVVTTPTIRSPGQRVAAAGEVQSHAGDEAADRDAAGPSPAASSAGGEPSGTTFSHEAALLANAGQHRLDDRARALKLPAPTCAQRSSTLACLKFFSTPSRALSEHS